jgi:group I intron endonuclease
MSGSIYKLTCVPTGLAYIGQTCDIKYRGNKPYNYGPSGRWSDHVSNAKRSKTALSKAILEHGRDKFTVEVLETDILERLDELEAKWIERLNTVVPNGYNVMVHSREKHRLESTLANHYSHLTNSATIRPICRNGIQSLVYVVLHMKDGTSQRLCFGQDGKKTFEQVLEEAKEFVGQVKCPVRYEDDKISAKLEQFVGKVITKIRITTASALVAVYVTTSEMTRYTEQIRICFGGKIVSQEKAYEAAKKFIDMLGVTTDCKIEDHVLKSSQQATTVKGEVPPS